MTSHTDEPTISLIIPIYNEASSLERFLGIIDALELPAAKELVIVDDGSMDGSAQVVKDFRFRSRVEIVTLSRNAGKGAAIRTGIARASGDIIGIQDADFEYDPRDIARLVTPLLRDEADRAHRGVAAE